ncbi:MAG: hypothetical protein EXR36_03690 [Betaproteobacteria bacterium]|nr:hypothetical protein [Betaproteobacteria bacterium]
MALVLTNIYLEPSQKKFLEKRAKQNDSNVSVEARNAIDLYKLGISAEDLDMLDKATAQAKNDIDGMIEILDLGARRAEAFFKKIDAIKRSNAE